MVKSVVLPMAREISAQAARKWCVLAGQWSGSAEDGREAGPRALMKFSGSPVLEQAALDFVQIEKVRRFDSCFFSDLDQFR
jgi:hypothetical protein